MKNTEEDQHTPMISLVEKQIEAFVESMRPEEELRTKVDIGYSFKNNTVEIFEIRPQWNDTSVIRQHPFAKARYVKAQNHWKIYWMPGSLKWTPYGPMPEVNELNKFFQIVQEDAHGCFFG